MEIRRADRTFCWTSLFRVNYFLNVTALFFFLPQFISSYRHTEFSSVNVQQGVPFRSIPFFLFPFLSLHTHACIHPAHSLCFLSALLAFSSLRKCLWRLVCLGVHFKATRCEPFPKGSVVLCLFLGQSLEAFLKPFRFWNQSWLKQAGVSQADGRQSALLPSRKSLSESLKLWHERPSHYRKHKHCSQEHCHSHHSCEIWCHILWYMVQYHLPVIWSHPLLHHHHQTTHNNTWNHYKLFIPCLMTGQ